MPRMPRDVILFVLAIILAVPIGIATNLITPALKDWFAAWSKVRLTARIEELKQGLERAPSPFEWTLLTFIVDMAKSFFVLGMAIFVNVSVSPLPSTPVERHVDYGIGIFLYGVSGYYSGRAMALVNSYLKESRDSPDRTKYISKLSARIAKLEEKLSG